MILLELEIINLTKKYKDKLAVDNVSLKLGSGMWGLLGANGAGKTTLMRMVAGILKPTSGKTQYDGVETKILGESYRDIFGYLPQTFGFYPEFSVIDYLKYMSALKGLTRREMNSKIDELLEAFTLKDVRNKKIIKLSGGTQRRVGIAQALLNNPKVLILDEPTSGLDPGERVYFRNLLSELAENRIVLISTHIVPDVEYIATCNIIMKDGKIIAEGKTEELVRMVSEKVWQGTIPAEELRKYENDVQIVNVKNEECKSVSVRYLSDKPKLPNSKPVLPHLEDLYLWLFPQDNSVREEVASCKF